MSDPNVTTNDVVMLVEEYVRKELDDAKKYDNSTPLDESGIFSLHRLAAEIYGLGFRDGERVEGTRNHAKDWRAREATKAAAKAVTA